MQTILWGARAENLFVLSFFMRLGLGLGLGRESICTELLHDVSNEA